QTGAEFLDSLNNYSSFHLKSPISAAAPTLKVGRDAAGPQPVPRDRSRSALRPVKHRLPLFAGQPLKIAAVCLIAMMAGLFFPRRVQELGKGASGALAAKPEESHKETVAGFSVPPLGAQLSINPRPGDAAGAPLVTPLPGNQAQVKIPSGTDLYLDNAKLN